MLAAEVISVAAGVASTGDAASGRYMDLSGGSPTASVVSDISVWSMSASARSRAVSSTDPQASATTTGT